MRTPMISDDEHDHQRGGRLPAGGIVADVARSRRPMKEASDDQRPGTR